MDTEISTGVIDNNFVEQNQSLISPNFTCSENQPSEADIVLRQLNELNLNHPPSVPDRPPSRASFEDPTSSGFVESHAENLSPTKVATAIDTAATNEPDQSSYTIENFLSIFPYKEISSSEEHHQNTNDHGDHENEYENFWKHFFFNEENCSRDEHQETDDDGDRKSENDPPNCHMMDEANDLLQKECELCLGVFSINEIVSMLKCTHSCCLECARQYFTQEITNRSITNCNCPFCKEPDLNGPDVTEDDELNYFSNLDILLKTIVEETVHDLFQRKLRDRTLMRDPNFKRCVHCSSGFIAQPEQSRLTCPDCGSITCASCRKPWESQHEGLSCEKYAEWKEANDPQLQAKGVQRHLRRHGIRCPNCMFLFELVRGGCMHFTCTQCMFEFCYGCNKPFRMGARCRVSSYCANMGLHAHHPRNCLFYLRDKEPYDLQNLLQMNNVAFDTEPPHTTSHATCLIQVEDNMCSAEVPKKHAGLCRTHYVEYLVGKVSKAQIDPLPILDLTDCMQELRRRGIPLPERGPYDTDQVYREMCQQVIKDCIPFN